VPRLESVLSVMACVGCVSTAPLAAEKVAIPSTAVSFDLVRIEGGLRPFWIGRREVTWEEMNLFTELAAVDGVTRPTRAKSYFIAAHPPEGSLLPRRPVINVRWHAAMAYCAWLSARTGDYYRLPTEREWEAACRGTSAAWHRGNSGGRTHDVGTLSPNAAGLHDMLGNVAEYCLEPRSPPDYGPVLKGGSWDTPAEDVRPRLRESVGFYREDSSVPQSIWWVSGGFTQGFRIVRVPGAASRAELDATAPRLEVRVLKAEPRTAGTGGAVQFFVRVRGEIRNGGHRAIGEVQLVVYPLTPRGRPHWVDTGSADKPGRATFSWCHPALRNATVPAEHGRPIRPGGTRTFSVDVPESFDDADQVWKGLYEAKVTALCFEETIHE